MGLGGNVEAFLSGGVLGPEICLGPSRTGAGIRV